MTERKSKRQEAEEEARYKAQHSGGEWKDHLNESNKTNGGGFGSHGAWSTRGSAQPGNAADEYLYKDADGNPYLLVTRSDTKAFLQFHLEGTTWKPGKPRGPKIPYWLSELIAAPPEEPVFVTEGEKDADSVVDLKLIATCASEGAGKWTPDLKHWFERKEVVYILEDNDRNGRRHARQVAQNLVGIVKSVHIVSLPNLPDEGDVTDWIEGGGTRAKLLKICAATPPFKDLPVITLIDGKQAEAVFSVMAVISERLELYKRGKPSELVRVEDNGLIVQVTAPWLQTYLDQNIYFAKSYRGLGRPKKDEPMKPVKPAQPMPADCPEKMPQFVIARTSELGVKELDGIITAPTLRGDGSLLIKPGYDEATKLVLVGNQWPEIPAKPTKKQLKAALATLWMPFEKFPFETEFDRGVMLASLLTAPIRRSLPLAPGFSYDAPQAGTGKTLLGKCVLSLTTTGELNILPECNDGEEIRKRILSILRQRTPGILFDNIRGRFKSSAVEMLLTSESFSDRLLGANHMPVFPTNILVLISGNNLQPTGR
jgi:putative DNA primase/helicase